MRRASALLCAALAGRAASAQVGAGIGALYLAPSGQDFRGTNSGPGIDAQLRWSPSHWISFGVGAQWSSHHEESLGSNITVLGVFVEPRYGIPVPPSVAQPYVVARLGYVHERVRFAGTTYGANGRFYGFGGGLLLRVSPSAHIDLALLFAPVHFNDFSSTGGTATGTRTDGSAFLIRGGLVVGRGT